MDIARDLRRNAAVAFGPASAREGSILPFEGRSLMRRAEGLPQAALDATEDGLLAPDNPILVRGLAKILPLAWQGDQRGGSDSGVAPEEIAAFASQMQAAGLQWAGNWRVLDLGERRDDSIGSYAAALRTAGATRTDCWTYSETIGVSLVWAGASDAGTESLALHVVPVSWVSEPRVKKPVRGIDVRWSWSDVIALHAAQTCRSEPQDAT
ncbi:MAG TPA: hypothetical protein VNJ54_03035 [Plantibacter sp.]|uniref:hypothetical protein n=1 Tax=unclassified Plantibacter TaxID=2624265 RepID=UPI002BABBFD9|nr:hypothetical protein [Plantibacter sp.]